MYFRNNASLAALILTGFLLLFLAGCGGGGDTADADSQSLQTATTGTDIVNPNDKLLKPTLLSMDFFGYIDGITPGDLIQVYDPDGVLCGEFTVNKNGQYGFLHVYGDDISTEEDEGANAGDLLSFLLNGEALTGPDVFWAGDGERMQVDFALR